MRFLFLIKQFCLLFMLLMGINSLVSCTNGQKNDLADQDKSEKKDETTITTKSGIVPPDSNYTGDYLIRYPNGVIRIKGYFRFGKKAGKWMYFYENGRLCSEAFFQNDVMHGESNVYYPNGQLRYSAFYNHDKAANTWKFYDENGKFIRSQKFDTLIEKPAQNP